MAPGDDLADIGFDPAEPDRPSGFGRLDHEAGDEVELDREPGAAMQLKARHKPAAREEAVGLFHVAEDEDVLPGDKDLVHDEDRVVLVEPAR